jgi:hypothetical protein
MAVIKSREIDDFSTLTDTIGITHPSYSSIDYGAIPTISVADLTLGNITLSNGTNNTFTIGSAGAAGANANAVWTTSGAGYNWSGTGTTIGTSIGQSGKLSLNGKDADLDINGKSLNTWMEKVEERLNILTPNPELEKEWDELRRLGERYRKLEKKCKEKSEVWKKLKSMPPPNLG